MAVNKQALTQVLTATEDEAVKRAEKDIDDYLTKNYKGEPIAIAIPTGGPRVVATIIKLYEKQSWTVRRVDDQRDGDYLNFS